MKERIKQISASLLAAIMVFTYMPVLGLGAVYADDTDDLSAAAVVSSLKVKFDRFTVPYTGEIPDLSGEEALQSVTVVGGELDGLTLYINDDYTVAAKAKKPTAHGVVEFTGVGNYEGVTITSDNYFTILAPEPEVKGYAVTVPTEYEYDGEALSENSRVKDASFVVKSGNTPLRYFDVEVTPVDPEAASGNAGEVYTVKYFDKGDQIQFTANGGTEVVDSIDVQIVKKDITNSVITATFEEVTYNGQPQEPGVIGVVKADGLELDAFVREFDGETNINATTETSKAKAYINADAGESKNFTGTATTTFSINKYEYRPDTLPEVDNVKFNPKEFTYDGTDKRAEVTVSDSTVYFHNVSGEEKYAIPKDDYTIVVNTDVPSVDAGQYSVMFVPSGKNIAGPSFPVDGQYYTINKYNIKGADIKVSFLDGVTEVPAGIELDEKIPGEGNKYYFERYYKVTFKGEEELEYGKDYTVRYKTNGDHNRVGDTYVFYIDAADTSKNFTGTTEGREELDSYTAVVNKFDADFYVSQDYSPTYNGSAHTADDGDGFFGNHLGDLYAADENGNILKDEDGNYVEVIPAGKYETKDEWKDNVYAGVAKKEMVGLHEYENETATATFIIKQRDLSDMRTGNHGNNQNNRRNYAYISGLSAGQYFKGKTITGTNLRVYVYMGQNNVVELRGSDVDVKAQGFTYVNGYGGGLFLTSVRVTPKGNYTYKSGNNDYFDITLHQNASTGYNPSYAQSQRVAVTSDYDLHDDATVTCKEMPARMTEAWYKAHINEYVDVVIGGESVSTDSYTVDFAVDQTFDWTQAVAGKTIPIRVDAKDNTGLTGESQQAEIKIGQREISESNVALEYPEVTYNGSEWEPQVTVTLADDVEYGGDGAKADEENDFVVEYADNKNAGEATVTVTGKDGSNYKGKVEKTFTIKKRVVTEDTLKKVIPDEADRVFAVGPVKDLGGKFVFTVIDGDFEEELAATEYTITPPDLEVGPTWDIANDTVDYALAFNEDSNFTSAAPFTVSYYLVPRDVKNGDAVVTFDGGKSVKYLDSDIDSYQDYITKGLFEVTIDGAEVLPKDYKATLLTNDTDDQGNKIVKVGSSLTVEIVFGTDSNYNSNYRGRDISNKVEVVANDVDLSKVKLVEPTVKDYSTLKPVTVVRANYVGDLRDLDWSESATLYYGLDVEVTYEGKVLEQGTDYTINKYYFPDGSADITLKAKSPVGHYTVKTKPAYGFKAAEGTTCDEIGFDIVPQKVNAKEFEKMVKSLRQKPDTAVRYSWKGNDPSEVKLTGVFASEFEVTDITPFEGGDAMTGTATVALKEDSNYVFNGTGEVAFAWEKGDVYWDFSDEDWNEIYYIENQEFLDRACEPTEVKSNYETEFPTSWVTVTGWHDNTSVTSAAYAEVTITADGNKYVGDTYADIRFRITTYDVAKEEAKAAIKDAEKIDDTYSADAAKAVNEAKAALEDAIAKDAPKLVIELTKKLNDAIAAADAEKAANENAKADALKAAEGYTTDAGYDAASVKAVADAASALKKASKFDDVVAATDALNKAMAEADKKAGDAAGTDAKAALNNAAKYTDDNYTFNSVKAINEAKAALEKALAGGNTVEIRTATIALNSAIKAAVKKTETKIKLSPKKKTIKAKKLKKKAQKFTVKAEVSSGATPTFKKVGGSKKLKISSTGKIKVKKKTKKGSYKIKVQVTVPKTETSKAKTITKTIKVKVK